MRASDYGESHYIGPIDGAQPNSQEWVDGFNHTGKCRDAVYILMLLWSFRRMLTPLLMTSQHSWT